MVHGDEEHRYLKLQVRNMTTGVISNEDDENLGYVEMDIMGIEVDSWHHECPTLHDRHGDDRQGYQLEFEVKFAQPLTFKVLKGTDGQQACTVEQAQAALKLHIEMLKKWEAKTKVATLVNTGFEEKKEVRDLLREACEARDLDQIREAIKA